MFIILSSKFLHKERHTNNMKTLCRTFALTVLLCVFEVPSTEGIKCLSCSDVSQPRLCHLIDECEDGESCSVQMYRMENGVVRYKTGCISKTECDNTSSNLLHNAQVLCNECCSSDLCNVNGCGSPGYPAQYGPVCYDCDDELSPDTCKRIKLCSQNEICAMEERREFMQSTYKTQCLRTHICDAIYDGTNIIGRRKRISFNDILSTKATCNYCCGGQLCNTGCSPTKLSTLQSTTRSTPVSSTKQTDKTTTNNVTLTSSTPYVTSTATSPMMTPSVLTNTISFSAKTNSSVYPGKAMFLHLFSNDGNSFDPISGVFTCPRGGFYYFTWTIQVIDTQVMTSLVLNGKTQKELVTIPAGGNNESNTAIIVLQLLTGDRVWIEVTQGKMLPNVCSFSGWEIIDTDVLVYSEYVKNVSKYHVIKDTGTDFDPKTKIFTTPRSGTYLFYLSTNRGQNCDTGIDDAFYYSGGDGTSGAFIKTMSARDTVSFNVYCTFNIIILHLGTREWFSASSDGTRSDAPTILPFNRKVFSYNPNNVFDPSRGVYTCELSGTYVLTWTIENQGKKSVASNLLVNGDILMEGYTTSSIYGSSNNVVIVHLNHGDTVSIRTQGLVYTGYTMFTGFRLHQ